ncbi:RIP metalloprotease RseP [Leptobacterium sp. I13]|uniref:RIP metalloprotease RseP n=1 Tax=Leptobacterium meishanense TaxID=3128904 RepID=UPI0030ED9EAC
MSPILIKTIQLLLSLSILIVLHELGHFIPAKIFKTRVEKFFLFFDVKFALFKKKIGETVYGIGWLPLGGYVKISGMIDESMDKEQMKEPPKPWEFRSKPAWQRLIIMIGGVTVNFIVAILIYIGMSYSYGEQYLPIENIKDGLWVTQTEMGDALGVQTGDYIVAIDGEKIATYNELPEKIINGNVITIKRDGTIFDKAIPVDFISKIIDNQDSGFFLYPRVPFIIADVDKNSPNIDSGLKKGDQILSIGSYSTAYYDHVAAILEENKGQTLTATVKRTNGDKNTFPIIISNEGTLGVITAGLSINDMNRLGILKMETKKYTFLQSIPAGFHKANSILSSYVKQLKKIINPETGAYKGVGGFAAIGNLFPDQWNWIQFWETTALISVILAFMNILPIPALDGGHVTFLLYEMITGRKPGDKFMEYAQMLGFFLLIALLLFANGNDIYRWLFSK